MKLIIFSLKRSSFLLLLAISLFSPFTLFAFVYDGEEYTPLANQYVYQLATFTSLTSYTVTYKRLYDYSPYLAYSFSPFSVVLNKNTGQFSIPNNFNHTSVQTNSAASINFPISARDKNGNIKYFSVFAVPELSSMFQTVSLLYANGYDGPGFTLSPSTTSSTYLPIVVNWRDLLADVLGGTNGVWRSILLSQTMSIVDSIHSIGHNTAVLQSSVDYGNSLLSGVQSAVEQGNVSLSNINVSVSDIRDVSGANLAAVSNISESAFSISSNSVDILRGVDLLHDDWLASSIDVFLGDDTEAWVNFLNIAVEQGLLSESDALQYESTLRSTDPSRKKSYSIPDAHRRFFAKNSIKGAVVEAQQMRGRYQTFRNWTNQRGEMFGAMDSTWNSVAGDRINSIVGSHVDDWRAELRQQLQEWKTSDERGILNIRKIIEDNFSTDDPRTPGISNSVPFTVFQTNEVTRIITNTIDNASGQIQSNATENTNRQITDNQERWDEFKRISTGDGDGLNVRIKFPLYPQDGPAVNVHDTALDVFGVGVDEINYNLARMLDNFDSRWETWFRLWGGWSSPVATNIEEILQVLLNLTNTTVQLDHVLFQDYSNYVFSASYNDLFSTLENDYPVCYSNLVKFGLSSSGDGGRWWNVLASSVSYDTAMLSYVFNDMVQLDRIASDSLGKSPFSFLRQTLSDMPSKSQIEDYVSQASNATFQISSSLFSLTNSLHSVSNSYVSVFKPFRGSFDSPGDSVTFFKLFDGYSGQYVTIPVSDAADAWRYIRLGVSFGLVAVNILLFPKYLLVLFILFIKAYRVGIKFFPDDR